MKKIGIILMLMAIVAGVFSLTEFNKKEDLKGEREKYDQVYYNYRNNGQISHPNAREAMNKSSDLSTRANRHNDNSTYAGIGAGVFFVIGSILLLLARRRKE